VIEWLPTVNAVLNFTSFVCLVAGRVYIGRGEVAKHRASMIAALVASVLFLVSYLVYHAYVGATRFAAPSRDIVHPYRSGSGDCAAGTGDALARVKDTI